MLDIKSFGYLFALIYIRFNHHLIQFKVIDSLNSFKLLLSADVSNHVFFRAVAKHFNRSRLHFIRSKADNHLFLAFLACHM